MSLTFDSETHIYRWDGVVVPGVTDVISGALGFAFANVAPATLEYARQRGKAVHKACELDSVGCLDDSTISPEIAPHVKAWREFREARRPRIIASELPMYSPTYRFAGTPDLVIDENGAFAVPDIKSGGVLGLRVGLQTAAYARLIEEKYSLRQFSCWRYVLRLKPNGKFAFERMEYAAADWRDFLSCLNVHNLKLREAA